MQGEYDGTLIQVIEVYLPHDKNKSKRMGYEEAAVLSLVQISKYTSRSGDECGKKNKAQLKLLMGAMKTIKIKINNQINAKYVSFFNCHCILV